VKGDIKIRQEITSAIAALLQQDTNANSLGTGTGIRKHSQDGFLRHPAAPKVVNHQDAVVLVQMIFRNEELAVLADRLGRKSRLIRIYPP
jgi:hypothetical protein